MSFKKNQGPVDATLSPFTQLKTLDFKDVTISGGFWLNRQEVNQKVSLKHAYAMLQKAGNIENLKLAAGLETGEFKGRNFSDETVYKWLEAMAWELGRSGDEELKILADEVIMIIQAAQQEDGYLDSYYQLVEPDQKFTDLDHSHELYCAGHFIQAAVAFKRAVNDDRLLEVACRLVDNLDSIFGPGKREGTCGHPIIEMALVELYRVTAEARYLRLAQFFIDQRGKGRMRGYAGYGAEYHQDHVPVRAANEVIGHAVRQVYLLSGVTDLYMETGEKALIDASLRLWNDLTQTKMYITGGVGSRYDGESFGNAYELPTDVCYCETCAAIGSLFWNWRLLLITGNSQYADLIERTLYNGILSSPGLDGSHFYYVNPLMVRDGRYVRLSSNPPEGKVINGRPEWHDVACCPPNVMRLFASLNHYFATQNSTGIQIHQYGQAEISVYLDDGNQTILKMDSNYPWDGKIRIRVEKSSGNAFALSLRIPAWSRNVSARVNGELIKEPAIENGYLVLNRPWIAGDILELDLSMQVFLVESNPRIDATRGCLAIQRGPLIYCLEAQDQPAGVNLLDVQIDPDTILQSAWRKDLGGIMTVEAEGFVVLPEEWQFDLYRSTDQVQTPKKQKIHLTAIPYYAWGNRGLNSMRVWIPVTEAIHNSH
jgi:uncharacterized protein